MIDTCVKASTQPPQWSTKQRPLSQPWSPLGPPARGAQPLNPHLAELGVIVTERDRSSKKDTLPELDPLREQGVAIHETSAIHGTGVDGLRGLLQGKVVVLLGPSGVGKSTLVNALHPVAALKTGGLTKFGTGKQTTTASRWLAIESGGTLVDTPGVRTLSVRGLHRSLLERVFPEFPVEVLEDPMAFDADDEETLDRLELDYPERLQSLQRLWQEMDDRNPNQNVWR